MNRRLLATIAVAFLFATAGCTTFLGDEAGNPTDLSENATYDFDTDRDAYIVVNQDNYTAVYNVSDLAGNTTELYTTDSLSVEQPLSIRGLQYRYADATRFPDGTILRYTDENATNATRVYPNGSTETVDTLDVDTTRKRTQVQLPDEPGQLAFTAPKDGKELAIRPPVNGSFELVLPPDTDAALPLLSEVRPSNDDKRTVDGRVHLTWENIEDPSVIIVRWYLDRDLWLFGGLAAVGIAVGLLGAGYYYLQLQQARKRREAEGIDVDYDDDGRDPPPGMG